MTAAARMLGGLLLIGSLEGCTVSAAEREAISRAWAERDAEWARECRRSGGGWVAGGCVRGGP